MFTFSFLYVAIYIFVFISLLAFVFTQLPIFVLTNSSISTVILFIQRYLPAKNLFFFLIFSLTGLPPLGLFFVKFNILTFILYQVHFFVIVLLFLFFFLNMLYYVQLLHPRNAKKKSYHNFNAKISFNIVNSSSRINPNLSYKSLLFIVNVLFFIFSTVLVFNDLFFLFSFIKCQQ